MYKDDYIYNGPSGPRYRDQGDYARTPQSYDDPYSYRNEHARDVSPPHASPTRSSDLLDALSRLHMQQEHIMAALLDAAPAAPSPPFAEGRAAAVPWREAGMAHAASWPARPVPPPRSPSSARTTSPHGHRVYGDNSHAPSDVFVDANPFVAAPFRRDRPRPAIAAHRGVDDTFHDPTHGIYESLYGHRLDASVDPRARLAARPRRPVLESSATVAYYQRAASSQPGTASASRDRQSLSPPRREPEPVAVRSTGSGAPRSASARAAAPVLSAASSAASRAPKAAQPTSARGAAASMRSASAKRATSAKRTASWPATPLASRTVAVQANRSAAWAFKLVESIAAQTATRTHASLSGRPRGDDDADGEGSAADSVAALTVQCLSCRAGTFRWRPLLTDLAAAVHAYQHVCPASGVFRHYFIDSRPKSVVLFRVFCVVWQSLLRGSQVVSQPASTTDGHDTTTPTLVTRRYVDLREITMLLSVVLSALVVPEVRLALDGHRSATTAVRRAPPRGMSRAKSVSAPSPSAPPSPPLPRFAHRQRRLHTNEQREVQRLLLDWMEQSIRQARALHAAAANAAGSHGHGEALAEANLLAFDREGFVDAHALAQATVEALDVVLVLYEPEPASDAEAQQGGNHEEEEETLEEEEDEEPDVAVPASRPLWSSRATHVPEPAAQGFHAPHAAVRSRVLPLVSSDVPPQPPARHHADVQADQDWRDHMERDDAPVYFDHPPLPSVTPASAWEEPASNVVASSSHYRQQPPPPSFTSSLTELAVLVPRDEEKEEEEFVEVPVPRKRASTPPPSAVKRRMEQAEQEAEEEAAAAAPAFAAREADNDFDYAPHALARRLLEVDVSDYLDDFAADVTVASTVRAAAEGEPVATATRPSPATGPSNASEGPERTTESSPSPPVQSEPKDEERASDTRRATAAAAAAVAAAAAAAAAAPAPQRPPRPARSASSEVPIRVLSRSSAASSSAAPSPSPAPPAGPMSPAGTSTPSPAAPRPMTAIERYRQRQRAESTPEAGGNANATTATVAAEASRPAVSARVDRPTSTATPVAVSSGTAALLTDIKSRLRQSEARRPSDSR